MQEVKGIVLELLEAKLMQTANVSRHSCKVKVLVVQGSQNFPFWRF